MDTFKTSDESSWRDLMEAFSKYIFPRWRCVRLRSSSGKIRKREEPDLTSNQTSRTLPEWDGQSGCVVDLQYRCNLFVWGIRAGQPMGTVRGSLRVAIRVDDASVSEWYILSLWCLSDCLSFILCCLFSICLFSGLFTGHAVSCLSVCLSLPVFLSAWKVSVCTSVNSLPRIKFKSGFIDRCRKFLSWWS